MNNDYKPGDRVVLYRPHPVEGWLGHQEREGKEGIVCSVEFLHHGERYYYVQLPGYNNRVGVLHTMLRPAAAPLTPFEQSVQDYISSEFKT